MPTAAWQELKFYGTAVPDPVAKDDLATAIEKVDAEVAAGDLKAGDYTEASWTALENALGERPRHLER